MRCWRWRFAQTLGRPSRWPPMTEDGIPLETLLEHAARARRLAIVLDGDPAALELSTTPKKWRPRSVGARRGIRVNNLLAMANGSIALIQVAAHTEVRAIACSRCDRAGQYRLETLIARHGPDFGIPPGSSGCGQTIVPSDTR